MKKFLVISQFFYLLFLIPWLLIFGLSFMSFDGGVNAFNSAFVLGIGLYPVAFLICSIFAWVLHRRKQRVAIILNCIPLIWVVGVGGPVLFINIM